MNAVNTTFKHRLNAIEDGKIYNPHDAIVPALERAAAVADLIEGAYEVLGSDGFDANTLWRAAQAIRLEILDAKALLIAYLDEEQAAKRKA